MKNIVLALVFFGLPSLGNILSAHSGPNYKQQFKNSDINGLSYTNFSASTTVNRNYKQNLALQTVKSYRREFRPGICLKEDYVQHRFRKGNSGVDYNYKHAPSFSNPREL